MLLSLPLFLLQWAIGGLLFTWVTTKAKIVTLGYSWVNKIVYSIFLFIALLFSNSNVFTIVTLLVLSASLVSLLYSFKFRGKGVKSQSERKAANSQRVAKMLGIEKSTQKYFGPEYNPTFDLVAPLIGLLGLIYLGIENDTILNTLRIFIGTLFLGSITDAMLLGHWYLNQPGLSRRPLKELVFINTVLWFPLTGLYLISPGMLNYLSGQINDGYGGILGWFWAASVITTLIMLFLTYLALKEKQYSAVMAATGFLYLAILTAFGMDLVARGLIVSL